MENRAGKKQTGMLGRVCVVGAGVIGLGTATVLQERLPGCDVTIMAEKFSPNTTSDGSGGFWEPHLLHNTPEDKLRRWSGDTLEYLLSLITSPDAGPTGAKLVSGYMLASCPQKDPWWRDMVFGYRDITPQERKLFPKASWGRFYTSAQIDTKRLLPFLMKRFQDGGGKVVRRSLMSLEELCGQFDVVVNCAGIGAKTLVKDSTVFPVRGQIARVRAPWIKHFFLFLSDDNPETYILPGSDVITVGGTQGKDDWRTEVDTRDSESILRRAVDFLPSIEKAEVAYHWAGLRPCRPEVRLEKETIRFGLKTLSVVHNYGHGGAGVTLHHGCAVEASGLVVEALRRAKL